ncbi:hypothetical protein [Granulicella sp. S156]|jgi:hypothetical protein|uniref:hypothetical protein n=1 Tax=Granulicella sp. S156 TaxID=1747224 RepID=UPI00131EB354|nr:hypothetical protein [Granulicella sp. S156]
MTTSNFKVFGIPMQRRSTRRRLVVLTYLGLVMVCGFTLWIAHSQPSVYSWALYAAFVVVSFIFGGYGRYGLVKSFRNKPPRPEPPIVDVIRLHLQPEALFAADTSWKNDERELSRRDLAHYQAYQPLTLVPMVLLLLSSWALRPPHWVSAAILLQAIFAVSMFGTVLVVTLPSALILWTEPDMETP